jgi:DNA topoisomerase-1
MPETIRVLAGDCTTTFEGDRTRTQRGRVVVVIKPDRTTLVHDADGYQPVAWLTRPDSLTVEADVASPTRRADGDSEEQSPSGNRASPGDSEAQRVSNGTAEPSPGPREEAVDDAGFGVVARAGDQVLRVVCHRDAGRAEYPVSEAGVPVGTDPETGEPLVRAGGDVVGADSDVRYPLPRGATVTDGSCPDCGLPTIRAEAGAAFEVCLDRACDPLDDAVADRFDREWTCPECGADLRIIRRGGRLLAGCDAYPDCETAFAIPAGVVDGACDCGLPTFETARGRRCLDGGCERFAE